MSGYLSSRHAAEYLDLTWRAFDQAVRRHGIPYKWFGRQRRFKVADLERVLDAMTARPKSRRRAA